MVRTCQTDQSSCWHRCIHRPATRSNFTQHCTSHLGQLCSLELPLWPQRRLVRTQSPAMTAGKPFSGLRCQQVEQLRPEMPLNT